MGENLKVKEWQSTADELREQIRQTEGDITNTVHTLEQKLSPRYLGQWGTRNAQRTVWLGTAKLFDLAQRSSVQASLIGGSALWLIIRQRKRNHTFEDLKSAPAAPKHAAGTAAKAAVTTGLWMLLGKDKAEGREKQSVWKSSVSGMVLAATAAKAFLSGARFSGKGGTTQPGRKIAWRGLATAVGSALGSYWYSHRGHKV